jgi:hypothetical protein
VSAPKKPDPYNALHWVALVGQIGAFIWGVFTLARLDEGWLGQLIAAALLVGGCTYLLSWINKQRLNNAVPDMWARARNGDKPAEEQCEAWAPAGPSAVTDDDDADWKAGE